jgi:PKD repeat protein
MVFTLTAVDMDGVESPPSNEFAFSLPSQDEFGNYLPVINFQTDTASGTTPLVVAFDASLSTDFDGAIVSYQWDFADGTVGSGATISHVFETPGVFGVSLTIIDNDGAAVSSAVVITVEEDPNAVSNVLPTALINATPNDDGSITFDAYDSEDPDGTIQTYTWDFGDGSSGSGLSVVHDYAAAGNYTVTLSVVDDEGGISSDQLVVSIVDGNGSGNASPESILAASAARRTIHLEWEYNDSNTIPAGFRLYQNNNLACEVADPDARQMDCSIYVEEGSVELFLTAFYPDQTETNISNIFTFDSTGLFPSVAEGGAPHTVQFNGGLSYDPDGEIASYAWDFGDGTVATGSAVQHIFSNIGVYTVTLMVTDNQGATAQSSITITVAASSPHAANGGVSPVSVSEARRRAYIQWMLYTLLLFD